VKFVALLLPLVDLQLYNGMTRVLRYDECRHSTILLSAGSVFDKSAFSLAKHFHLARVDRRPVPMAHLALQFVVLFRQLVHDPDGETVFLPLYRLFEYFRTQTVKPNSCDNEQECGGEGEDHKVVGRVGRHLF